MTYGLDTDSFLKAFYRMAYRRGLPREMLSDNSGNFVRQTKSCANWSKCLTKTESEPLQRIRELPGTSIPQLAPHFGGVHETMIKAVKRAVHAILGNANINDEELMTAFTGAEALSNSRPLTY